MDGKKRIARLRNLAKKQGLQAVLGFQARDGPLNEEARKERIKKILDDFAPLPLPKVTEKPASDTKTGVFASAAAFRAALEKRGFKKLGEGHYSAVYGKEGYDRVIKVTRMLDNWIDYVAWASKNGYAGNFAPMVYSWKRFKGEVKARRPWEYGYNNPGAFDWSIAVVERMKETVREDSAFSADFKIIERVHDLSPRSVLAELVIDEIAPGAGKFFKDLHKAFHASDIYGKNMMLRENGSFCVTDPVCGTVKTEATRFRAGNFTPPLILLWRYVESSS